MSNTKALNKKKGFTLIELVIVLVILGILAAVIVPRFVDLQADATDAAKNSAVNTVRSSLTLYIADNKTYPTVTQLADYIQGENVTAVAAGVQIPVNNTNYVVQTYTDPGCATSTQGNGDTGADVQCIGAIS